MSYLPREPKRTRERNNLNIYAYINQELYLSDFNTVLSSRSDFGSRTSAEACLIELYDYFVSFPNIAQLFKRVLHETPQSRPRSDKSSRQAFANYDTKPYHTYREIKRIFRVRKDYGSLVQIIDNIVYPPQVPLTNKDLLQVFEAFEVAMMKSMALTKHIYVASFESDMFDVDVYYRFIHDPRNFLVTVDYQLHTW